MHQRKTNPLSGAVIVILGFGIFALFIHYPIPAKIIAFAALLLISVVMTVSGRSKRLMELFGFLPVMRSLWFWLLPGVLAGTGLGVLTRLAFDLTPLPQELTWVAVLAPIVGIAEELIFRGFIQGHIRKTGRWFSIIFASAGHTLYKVTLILSLAGPLEFRTGFLIFWTFSGGILFGLIREFSGNVTPAALAHACFDIVLYGAFIAAPVWVWS